MILVFAIWKIKGDYIVYNIYIYIYRYIYIQYIYMYIYIQYIFDYIYIYVTAIAFLIMEFIILDTRFIF